MIEKRIQRKSIKGFDLKAYSKSINGLPCVSISAPTKWNNPFRLFGDMIYIDAGYRRTILDRWVFVSFGNKAETVVLFKKLFLTNKFDDPDFQYWSNHFHSLNLLELKNKNISCWCKEDEVCHGDVLLEFMNYIKDEKRKKDIITFINNKKYETISGLIKGNKK